ncbi:MAG: S8 family serine peptidase [Pseudomonadota bacterium]
MLKSFTTGTAGIAIAASLVGTAHAQEIPADLSAVAEEPRIVLVTDSVHEDAQSDEEETVAPMYAYADAESSALAHAASYYPTDLLASDAALAAASVSISPAMQEAIYSVDFLADAPAGPVVSPAPVSTGIVTPQSVDPLYGHINPFYGNISPFYGDIDAFWGNINPFYGHINPFYGDIDAFWGHINPFYGHINPFYGDIGAFWGNIRPFDEAQLAALGKYGEESAAQIGLIEQNWSSLKYGISVLGAVSISYDGTPDKIRNSLETLISQAEAQFGDAYTAKTGKSFRDGFVAEVLDRHGLDLTNSSSAKETLAKNEAERAAFYLDWHDSLMQYSGVDQVDHWMAAINWTPSVTEIQGEGADTIIGIVDGSFSADADLGNNVLWTGGNTSEVGGHGVGVASLIAGAHDGEGIMGIAPEVHIAAYNPFGADGTSSWDDVRNGITTLMYRYLGTRNETGYVSIVNLSLGESGWTASQGLADTLASPLISPWFDETVYVVAAGNDGITQNTDINWDFGDNRDPSIIFVGSINPLGEISDFSNRPGNTCLLTNGVCQSGNELMNRFIVAPGELILVSDGQGGVVRRSGTSFAAPLVSGAISLLHDRWPWLVRHSEETTEIVFRSARDLGAPGVDAVYGHGLLDVTASQSPLDFNAMTFNSYQKSNITSGDLPGYARQSVSVTELLGGIPSWWETEDVFFTMFEEIGDTYRDFSVPVSAFQYGQTNNVLGRTERLQDFVSQRFFNWINSGGTDTYGDGQAGFSEVRSNGAQLNGDWALRYDAIMPTVTPEGTWRPTHSAATLTNPNGKMSFTLGHGQGAMALGGYRFGVISDHDPFTGGVNPVLGFASGEIFAAASYKIAPGTSVKLGYSENREEWDEVGGVTAEQLLNRRELGDRPATAFTLDIEQKVSESVSVGVNYTNLREVNALLGTQTSASALLGNGSQTDAMTVSASFNAGNGLSFDLSATGARTETAEGQVFSNAGKIWSTAGQFTATKRGLFSDSDSLRLSVAQPLQVEQGSLSVTSDVVLDRETGEIGQLTQTFGIETRRRVTGEAVYAMPLTRSSEFGVFGRYVSAGEVGDDQNYVVGGNFSLRF